MKKILYPFLLYALFAFATVDLKPVDANDSVTFVIKNFGINTAGEFKGLKGIIKWDPVNPAASSFNVSVDVNTINTGIEMRDDDLKKESYFNAAQYPTVNFVTTAVTQDNITGNLTIKNITKQISFPFSAKQSGGGYLFEGSFTINRRDFGVGGSSFSLSDNVNVNLRVQANN